MVYDSIYKLRIQIYFLVLLLSGIGVPSYRSSFGGSFMQRNCVKWGRIDAAKSLALKMCEII